MTQEAVNALKGHIQKDLPPAPSANGRKPDGDVRNSEQPARLSQSTKLVTIAIKEQVELWHTPDSDAYVTFQVERHNEHRPISSKAFKRWLSFRYYHQHGGTPNAQAAQDAISVLAGKALYEGKEHSVHTRVCETNGAVYLDLADDDWRAVQISKDGWQVVDNPGVKFRRSRGTLALPEPVMGGKLKKLRDFINVASDGDWALVLSWLVTAIRGTGPFAVLWLGGEHGSAKSTLVRVLRSLIDPNTAPLRSEPKEPRDLMIAATNSWVVALDNLSHLPGWLSDALCRLSTGGGFTTRELYTDGDEYIFDAQRPVILNGINDVIQRSDLLDRRVNVELPVIDDSKRLPEKVFWERFERVQPEILGALLDAVVESLRREDSVVLPSKPRMADFAVRAVAAESKFGVKAGTFMEAYTGNRAMAHDQAIDASPIGPHLRQLAEKGFVGTATELLGRLNGMVDENIRRSKEWPTRANVVSGIVRRLAPNLRAVGIMVVMGKSGDRFIEIRKGGENIV